MVDFARRWSMMRALPDSPMQSLLNAVPAKVCLYRLLPEHFKGAASSIVTLESTYAQYTFISLLARYPATDDDG